MAALEEFEQVRSFFLQKGAVGQAPAGRVRILAFSSEKEYKPYRLNEGSFAYYQRTRGRDYIVMQDIDPEHQRAAIHEYTHLVMDHGGLKVPLWLSEGLADLYSSLEPRGRQAMIGRPLPGYYAVLDSIRLLDWEALFAVDRRSAYYNESDKMSVFYAQSWLLTHMLMLSDGYSAKFCALLHALAGGSSASAALQEVYGKSVPEIAADAEAYRRKSALRAALFDVQLQSTELDPQIALLPRFQLDLALADLLAGRVDKSDDAQQRLTELAEMDPRNGAVEESLGYLAWQQNNRPEACRHFGRALELGSRNSAMVYLYAQLEHSSGAPPFTVMALFKQVLALDPQNEEARVSLLSLAVSQKQYQVAETVAAQVRTLRPAQAFMYFAALAFCRANLQDTDGAKTLALKALTYAHETRERQEMESLLSNLNRFMRSNNRELGGEQ